MAVSQDWDGYNQQANEDKFPEFYEKLKDLKIAIVPDLAMMGICEKKIQIFNNSVGYASREEGGNLIVKEQWLENPSWTIYLQNEDNKVDEETFNKLKNNLLSGEAAYIPYLGKNEHPANIDKVEIVNLEKGISRYIDSLFIKENIEIDNFDPREDREYLYKEMMPIALNEEYNFYEFKEMMFTNFAIEDIEKLGNVYTDGMMTLYFY